MSLTYLIGLETLGIMHPHWHSASIDVQRKLISLYILSLTPSPSNAAQSAFDSELTYARDPHDLATVLRWGLRHLKLEGSAFGKDSDATWYEAFARAERQNSFPPKAYNDILLPLLPPAHLELLNTIVNLMSTLASHSMSNGVSGSKMSMLFGYALLTGNKLEATDDLMAFYDAWDRAGRMLEHIFLSHIR